MNETTSNKSNGKSTRIPYEEPANNSEPSAAQQALKLATEFLTSNPRFADGVAVGAAVSSVLLGGAFLVHRMRKPSPKPNTKTTTKKKPS